MPITTSYFAVCRKVKGTKISVARFVPPYVAKAVDERMVSFAPSKELIRRYKTGRIGWTLFRRKYLAEQRKHFKAAPNDFENLRERAKKETLVLVCFEKFEGKKTHCHRIVLQSFLHKLYPKLNIVPEYDPHST